MADDYDLTQGHRFLGRVLDLRTSHGTYHYAFVEPLVASDASGTTWVGTVGNPAERFPTRGRVFWHDVPLGTDKGSVWQFGLVDHPFADGGEKPERFQVDDPRRPIEIIDLRGLGDRTAVRTALSTGLRIEPFPLVERVLLWAPDDILLGPVQLYRLPDYAGWTIRAEDAARLEVRKASAVGMSRVTIDGPRVLVAPSLELGPIVGFQNWSSDYEIAKGVLRRLRKLDRSVVEALQVTDKVFASYVEKVQHAGLLGPEPALEQARASRVADLRDTIRRNVQLLDEAITALLETPQVRDQLDSAVREESQRLLDQRRAQLDLELADKHAQLKQLQELLVTQQTELRAIEAQLSARDAELQKQADTYVTALAQRVREIAERPQETFAELSVLRAVLGIQSSTGQSDTKRASVARKEKRVDRTSSVVTDPLVLRSALAVEAAAAGVSPLVALDLHAAFLAGAMPTIVGEASHALLRGYSSIVCDQRLLWIPISARVLESRDLLGVVDSQTRRLVQHPGGLLDLLVSASEAPQDLHLVVFEGMNRGPIESYLLPILASAQRGEGGEGAAIPIAAPGALDESEPYHDLRAIAWPPNVLLAGTPVFGVSALPVPTALWRDSILIDTEGETPTDSTLAQSTQHARSEVPYAIWGEWQKACLEQDATKAIQQLSPVVPRLPLDARRMNLVRRVYQGLRWNQLSHDAALRRTIGTSIVPRIPKEDGWEATLGPLLTDAAWLRERREIAQRLVE